VGEGEDRRREGRGDGGSLYEPRRGYHMMRVEAGELEEALREREVGREPVTGVEFLRVQGVQGLRGAGVLQGVRAMAARVYAGEEWYVQDDGGTGRVECLYEKARRGRGVVKFVVARLSAEDRWASDGRRAARADVVQGGMTTRDAGGAAPERATVDGEGGSAEACGGGKGAGGGECSVEEGGGKGVDDDRGGVSDGGGRAGAGRQTSVHKRSRGGGKKRTVRGGDRYGRGRSLRGG